MGSSRTRQTDLRIKSFVPDQIPVKMDRDLLSDHKNRELKMELDIVRILNTFNHEEPDRVPIATAVQRYGMMNRFPGKPVTDDDIAGQVKFWFQAADDNIPLTVELLPPGGVTRDSHISKVVERTLVIEDAEEKVCTHRPSVRS